MKVDREGQRRTAYSLRHTYISTRLMNGADIYQVAKNCRTSVEMIETYYASHIKNVIDASAINVRKARPLIHCRRVPSAGLTAWPPKAGTGRRGHGRRDGLHGPIPMASSAPHGAQPSPSTNDAHAQSLRHSRMMD